MLRQGWSLRHELVFYGLFSLCLLDKRLGWSVLFAWAGGTLWNIAWTMLTGEPWFSGIWNNLIFRVFNIQFFFGIAVAAAVLRGVSWRPRVLLVAGTAMFFGTGLADSWGPTMPHEWPPKHLAYALGSALALYGLVVAEQRGQLRVPRSMVLVGAASYSLYLIHLLVILIGAFALRLARPVIEIPLELAFLGIVAASVGVALLLYRLVELPLLQQLRHLGSAKLNNPSGALAGWWDLLRFRGPVGK